MKKLTFGGLTLIVCCFAALSLRIGCNMDLRIEQADVTPPEARMGWDEEAAKSEATKQLVATMPAFEIDGVKRDNRRANVRLWELAEQANIQPAYFRQEIGDCVSFGWCHAVNYLQCVQIALGQRAEYKNAFQPFVYGTSRVQVGGGRLGNSDGSVGAWAAKAVQTYGVLAADGAEVPKYSGTIAKQWGYRGPPEQFLRTAKETVVKTVAPVRSARDVRDAICSGYPVPICSNAGFSVRKVHDRQVGRLDKNWSHCMCLIAWDSSNEARKAGNGQSLAYCLNSWGKQAHPEPLQGEPPGGFWIRESDVERIVRQGDSFAISGFDGFPAQDLDFNVLRDHAQIAVFPIGKDLLMVFVFLFGLLLFALLIRTCRRSTAGVAAFLLCSSVAYGIDFDVMADGPPPITSFDVMASAPQSTLEIDFAVLCDDCQCEVTGECECPNCDCENCPKKKKKKDTRPVITVKTIKDCAPCKKAKADSKNLSDYRFKFVEVARLKGGAPEVSWQGRDGKYTINGWHGAEFFERVFEKSQSKANVYQSSTQRLTPIKYRWSDYPPVPIFSVPGGSCAGGACYR